MEVLQERSVVLLEGSLSLSHFVLRSRWFWKLQSGWGRSSQVGCVATRPCVVVELNMDYCGGSRHD